LDINWISNIYDGGTKYLVDLANPKQQQFAIAYISRISSNFIIRVVLKHHNYKGFDGYASNLVQAKEYADNILIKNGYIVLPNKLKILL
jgi:hypothetical protein